MEVFSMTDTNHGSSLYSLIDDGLKDIKNGNTRSFSDAITDIRDRRKNTDNKSIKDEPQS